MTIKEEIKLRAASLADFAIAHGAPWEDYNKGYIEGAEKAHEITVDRAVKWLEDNVWELTGADYSTLSECFIKAMQYDTD